MGIDPAVAVEIRDLLLRADAASAAAAEAVRMAEAAEVRARAVEALALRLIERLSEEKQRGDLPIR
jgi:hypothetical protein